MGSSRINKWVKNEEASVQLGGIDLGMNLTCGASEQRLEKTDDLAFPDSIV
jgi:hypothetical protein